MINSIWKQAMTRHAALFLVLSLGAGQASAVWTITRTSAFEYDASGRLIREVIEPGNSSLCLAMTHAYDAFGNRTSTTTRNCNGTSSGGLTEAPAPTGAAVIETRTASTQFASGSVTIDGVTHTYPAGRFPTGVTNALAQTETRRFDPRFGGMVALTGPNALTTTWSYDRLGRKLSETRADGTSTNWTYALCGTSPNICGQSVTVTATGMPASTTHFDSLSRPVRTEVQGFAGTLVRTDTQYDAQGRIFRASQPYFDTATPVWTTYTYDILGRMLTATDPVGGVTTKTYSALTTVTMNPKKQKETEIRNSQGLVRRISRGF